MKKFWLKKTTKDYRHPINVDMTGFSAVVFFKNGDYRRLHGFFLKWVNPFSTKGLHDFVLNKKRLHEKTTWLKYIKQIQIGELIAMVAK